MDKKLLVFVEEQKKRGINKDSLRQDLMLHGWKKEDVDYAIKNVYGFSQRLFIGAGAVVLLLLLVILWVARIPSSNEAVFSQPELIVESPSSGSSSSSSVSLEVISDAPCSYVDDLAKDDCYFSLVEKGFSCDNLEGEELFVCKRNLEQHLISDFYN